MIRFAFKKGLRFIEGGLHGWTILKKIATGKIQLEHDSGEIKNLEPGELNRQWLDGSLIIDEKSLGVSKNVFYLATPRDLKTFDKRNQDIASRRQKYLMRLDNRPDGFVFTPAKLKPILEEIALEIGDPNPPAVGTIYRWWLKYRLTKCVTKLVDGRSNSGRKQNAVAYSLFEEAIYEVYLTKQKDQGKAVVESIQTKVKHANIGLPEDEKIKNPSPATVYRWLKDLHAYLVDRARLGKEAAEKEFRTVLKKLKVSRILERIEIDHTPLDLIIIDTITMLPLGRPWLTLAIDRYSRMIVGFYICFHAPSSFSVMQCLKRAILPKDAWLARFPDIKEIWPCFGIPELVATDNGMDLHADAVEEVCLEMGIELLFCPAGEPYFKGAIERMFRTLNTGLIHRLPGTVFSNVDERGDYPAEELAAIDMDTLMHLITKWIVEVYHRTTHRGIGMAPLTKWSEGQSDRIIELPAYPEQLDVLVGVPATRTLFHYGIENDCLRYNCPEIQLIRSREGGTPPVDLKFYEDTVEYVHMYDKQNGEYIKVPAVDMEYAKGLTRHMHTLIRAYAKKKYGKAFSDDEVMQSKSEIQSIVSAAVSHKKMGTRKKVAALNQVDSEGVLDQDKNNIADALKTVTPAELSVEELEPGLDDELPDYGTSNKTGTEG